jgi:hypothetical protein
MGFRVPGHARRATQVHQKTCVLAARRYCCCSQEPSTPRLRCACDNSSSGGHHGFRQRRTSVAHRDSAPDHSASRAVLALTRCSGANAKEIRMSRARLILTRSVEATGGRFATRCLKYYRRRVARWPGAFCVDACGGPFLSRLRMMLHNSGGMLAWHPGFGGVGRKSASQRRQQRAGKHRPDHDRLSFLSHSVSFSAARNCASAPASAAGRPAS